MLINPYIFGAGGVPSAAPFYAADPMLSTGWGTTSGPAAIYVSGANKTFVVWQFCGTGSPRKGVNAAAYDHNTDSWSGPYRVGNFALTNDDHGHPAIVRDADGYLHCFYGSHRNPGKYSISRAPDDVSAWTQQEDLTGNVTYPKPVLVGSTIYLFQRDDTDLNRQKLQVRSATPSSGTATFGTKTVLVDFGDDSRMYAADCHVVGTEVHFVATRADADDTTRKGVYYFIYETTTGAVKNYDGSVTVTSGNLPVDLTTSNSSFRIFAPTGDEDGNSPAFAFDSNGDAHVIFCNGESPDYELLHTRLSSGSWTSPVKIADIADISPFGAVDVWSLVPDDDGKMQAWFNSSDGDQMRAVYNGSTWGAPELIAAAGTYNFGRSSAVRFAHSNLRVVFAQESGTSTDANADELELYAYGDAGPITSSIDVSGGDPNWTNVSLLLGAEHANGAQRFIDDGPGSFRTSSVTGNAQVDTAQKKFGLSSIKFDGSGDSIRYGHSSAFSVASGDFTIECWVRMAAETGGVNKVIASKRPSVGNAQEWTFGIQSAGPMFFQMWSSDGTLVASIVGSTALEVGEWHHLAVTRDGSTVRIFLDGVLEGSTTQSASPGASNTDLVIGLDPSPVGSGRDFNGWLDEFRISRVARYTANFTPPAAAFPRY